ncbi:MAG: site-specific DNA-methyltransferase [Candidatus Micrarchaeaceae archaeon]
MTHIAQWTAGLKGTPAYINMSDDRIINSPVLDGLKLLPDESVDFIMTSPPYYGLRSYEGAEAVWGSWKGQLGLEPSYSLYIEHLLMVTKELKRVLKPSGTMFWNMGDSYASAGSPLRHKGYPDKIYPQGRNGSFAEPTAYDQGIAPKSLMLIPERFAIGAVDQGWILRNKVVWYKRNGMPASVKDRFTNKYEFVYFFTKSRRYYFNLDAVRKPLILKHIKQAKINNNKYSDSLNPGNVVEFFRIKGSGGNFDYGGINSTNASHYNEKGANPGDVVKIPTGLHSSKYADQSNDSNIGKYMIKGRIKAQEDALALYPGDPEAQKEYTAFIHDHLGHPKGKNPGDVVKIPAVRHKSWASNPGHGFTHARKYDETADGSDFFDIPTKPHSFAHFAVFPETLVEPFMKAGCPPGGVVLDPFAGSGTTAVVGKRLGHPTISIEISASYVEIIKQRLGL